MPTNVYYLPYTHHTMQSCLVVAAFMFAHRLGQGDCGSCTPIDYQCQGRRLLPSAAIIGEGSMNWVLRWFCLVKSRVIRMTNLHGCSICIVNHSEPPHEAQSNMSWDQIFINHSDELSFQDECASVSMSEGCLLPRPEFVRGREVNSRLSRPLGRIPYGGFLKWGYPKIDGLWWVYKGESY